MKKYLLLLLLLTTITTSASTWIRNKVIQPSIYPDSGAMPVDALKFLNFKMLARKDIEESQMLTRLELPAGSTIGDFNFKLMHGKSALVAENHIQLNGLDFEVAIPALKTNETALFSIGWIGATPRQYSAYMVVETNDDSTFTTMQGKPETYENPYHVIRSLGLGRNPNNTTLFVTRNVNSLFLFHKLNFFLSS